MWLKVWMQAQGDDPLNVQQFPAYCCGEDEEGFPVFHIINNASCEPEFMYDSWLRESTQCFETITEKEVSDMLWWEYDKHNDNF